MSADTTTPEDRIVELEEKVAELDALLAEKDAELEEARELVEEYKPTVDVSGFLMESPDDVKARFSEQHLRDIAAAELAEINRQRHKNGLPPITYSDEEWEKKIAEAVEDLINDRHRTNIPEPPHRLMRGLKLIFPDGSLRQVPYESQINNLAGSIADAIERYKLKGAKPTEPLLCPTYDCYRVSLVGDDGRFAYRGYCSRDHFQRTEPDLNAEDLDNIITRDQVRGMRR